MFSPFLESLAKRHHISFFPWGKNHIPRGAPIRSLQVMMFCSHRSVMGLVFDLIPLPCHGTMVYLGDSYIFYDNVGDSYINHGVKNLHLLVIFVVN